MDKKRQIFDVQTHSLNTLGNYTFVVIFARFNNQWVFCRHKERDTFETSGGKIEHGESLIEAAKRELYEETGATKYEIRAMFDYSVDSSFGLSNGQVFFADIKELGELPTISEMTEIKLFDDLPKELTYPEIQPILFKEVKARIFNANRIEFSELKVDFHRNFLIAAHKETSRITYGKEIDDEQIERELQRNAKNGVGAFIDGILIGLCDMETRKREDVKYGWVHFIYLLPEYRGCGFGKYLIMYAEEYCALNGLKLLGLRTGEGNLTARRLYERCGFIRASEYDRTPEVGYIKQFCKRKNMKGTKKHGQKQKFCQNREQEKYRI